MPSVIDVVSIDDLCDLIIHEIGKRIASRQSWWNEWGRDKVYTILISCE